MVTTQKLPIPADAESNFILGERQQCRIGSAGRTATVARACGMILA